jgi:hypothetical protein
MASPASRFSDTPSHTSETASRLVVAEAELRTLLYRPGDEIGSTGKSMPGPVRNPRRAHGHKQEKRERTHELVGHDSPLPGASPVSLPNVVMYYESMAYVNSWARCAAIELLPAGR